MSHYNKYIDIDSQLWKSKDNGVLKHNLCVIKSNTLRIDLSSINVNFNLISKSNYYIFNSSFHKYVYILFVSFDIVSC